MNAQLDFEDQLQAIPVRNEKITVSEPDSESGRILVGVQLRYGGLLRPVAAWANARRRKRYELVGLSRDVFERIDGKRTIEELIDWLCQQDNLTFLEGRALMLQYVGDLMERGLVVIAAAADD